MTAAVQDEAPPQTPELAQARERFAAGDFRTAGELARAALESAPASRPEVKLEAELLIARLDTDSFAKQVLVVCAVAFVLLAWFTLGH